MDHQVRRRFELGETLVRWLGMSQLSRIFSFYVIYFLIEALASTFFNYSLISTLFKALVARKFFYNH
jgi:hypothetical protein